MVCKSTLQLEFGRIFIRLQLIVIQPKKSLTANSDGLLNCLRQPGLLLRRPQKSMRENLHPLSNFLPPGLICASGTKSVGLAANAHGVMVFATPSRLFHRAPGLTGLTWTWYLGTVSWFTLTLQPSTRTCKNHATAT
jgi:hypothetical protein